VASSQAATASAGATEATESTMPGSTRRERGGSPGAVEASATGATGVMSTPTAPQTRGEAWDRSHGGRSGAPVTDATRPVRAPVDTLPGGTSERPRRGVVSGALGVEG
jgi:hypothetical protein